jgi:hypothetical protein
LRVKDRRVGEALWVPWDRPDGGVSYLTVGHVDYENEIVRRALASSMQRDGVVDSLSDGFALVSEGEVVLGWVGFVDGDREYSTCDETGETDSGESVDAPVRATIVHLDRRA